MTSEPTTGASAAQARPFADVLALALVLLAGIIIVATVANYLDLRVFGSRTAAVLAFTAALTPAVVLSIRMYREPPRADAPGSRSVLWAQRAVISLPALVLVVYLVVAFLQPESQRVEWFLNGDHLRNLVLVADENARGALDYAVRDYPRGWHSAVALAWSLSGASTVSPDLVSLMSLMSTLCWLLSAALALATSTLTASVAGRVGLRAWPSAFAGMLAGAATLWPAFFGSYQALGFEGTLTAALVLAVTLREVLSRLGSAVALATSWAGVVVMGHTWQLLMPVSGLAALAASWWWVKGDGWRRRLVLAIALAVVSGLAIIPPSIAVTSRVGVGQAVVADVEAPVPLWLLGVGLAAGVVLMAWRRRDLALASTYFLMALPAVTAVALAFRLGISVTRYYPAKLLWHSTILGLSWLAVLGVVAWCALEPRARGLRVVGRGLLGLAAAFCLLGAVWAPLAALRGYWSTADGGAVLRLVSTPGAGAAQVVWTRDPVMTDTATRILLDALKPEGSRADTLQHVLTLEEECELLREASTPVVLTDQPREEVLARYSCVPSLRVVAAHR